LTPSWSARFVLISQGSTAIVPSRLFQIPDLIFPEFVPTSGE